MTLFTWLLIEVISRASPVPYPKIPTTMSFLLGDEAREQAKRSIKGLVRHLQSSHDEPSHHEPIFLVLNTKTTLVKEKDHTPRIIPLTHKLRKIDEKTILFIVRDLSYREELTRKDLPTEDVFHRIIPYQKIKLIGHSSKKSVQLYKENDIVVADNKIYSKLPDILGAQFYGKNKKVPFKVQMVKPGHTSMSRLPCDPKYIRAQIRAILANTSFIPPANGNCINVVVGYLDWKVSEILTNINDVIIYLTDQKYRPVGGLLQKVENLHSVLIKTNNSVAMPVMRKQEEKAEESDMSDLDF